MKKIAFSAILVALFPVGAFASARVADLDAKAGTFCERHPSHQRCSSGTITEPPTATTITTTTVPTTTTEPPPTTTTVEEPPPPPTNFSKGLATGFRFAPNTTNVARAKVAGASVFREEPSTQSVGIGTNAEALCDAALANGIKWQILVLESWLTNISFIQQLAARYGPGGVKPCADVIELGNEPYWTGQSATTYGTNAKNAAIAAKNANSKIKIAIAIGGEEGLTWIDGLSAVGALSYADYFTHHPYSNRSTVYGDPTVWNPNSSDWKFMWQRFTKFRDKLVVMGFSQPWLLTETGWHTGDDDPGDGYSFAWSESQQADFIGKAFSLAHSMPWVAGMYVFALDDNPGTKPCGSGYGGEGYYGITRCSGTFKPSYAVFQNS